MRFTFIALWTALTIACAAPRAESLKPSPPLPQKQTVVVELFTSEGCSSCPSADRLLAMIDREQPYPSADVIALELHVDYWDRLGWKDPFSSAQFTQRQEDYVRKLRLDGAYTPQMVVDGSVAFVGSDANSAARSIAQAATKSKVSVALTVEGNRVKASIGDGVEATSSIFAAIAENDLTSGVSAGENSGRKLEHRAVVRSLRVVGKVEKNSQGEVAEFELETNSGVKPNNLNIVVFVQENDSRRIVGAARASIAK